MKTLFIAALAPLAVLSINAYSADLNAVWHGRWSQSDTEQLVIDADKFQIKSGASLKACSWSKDGKAPSAKGCWATYEGKVMSKDFANQEVAGADEQTRDLMKMISSNETFKAVQIFDAAPSGDKATCSWRYIFDKANIYKKGDCKIDGTVMLVLQKYSKQP
jgi:hypothetical protein